MNIRTRLRVSNLLMIVVPALVALAVGIAIILAVFIFVINGSMLGGADREDFSDHATQVFDLAAEALGQASETGPSGFSALEQALDDWGLSFVARGEGAGEDVALGASPLPGDEALLDAAGGLLSGQGASSVPDGASEGASPATSESVSPAVADASGSTVELVLGERALSASLIDTGAGVYEVFVLGTVRGSSDLAKYVVAGIAGAVLLIAIIVAAVCTNRFLTTFVLGHVTAPLDELVAGVREIRDGNLSVRLPAERDDEFAPVFADFNDMARRLEDSVERDRRAEEERRTLIVGLSHDLRSPLTSIQAYAEGLIDGIARTPEARLRYVKTIKTKAEELQRLVRQISLVSKMDLEAAAAHLERTRLDRAVYAWVGGLADAYAERGVQIEGHFEPVVAQVDDDLLVRVLTNLLDNCAKYVLAGREACRVKVRVEPSGETGTKAPPAGDGGTSDAASVRRPAPAARIVVSDDGPGVPDEDLPRLFDLFFRGDPARTSAAEGNGIGLAVVARAMERMGGSARVARSSEGGLAVELLFPPVEPGADADAQ